MLELRTTNNPVYDKQDIRKPQFEGEFPVLL
jgi:hypothetical protein